MVTSTQDSFSSLPFDLMQHIASFLGTPFAASKGVTVLARKLPYDEIFESYQKTIGSAKCDALVNDLITRKEPLIRAVKHPTNEQKMRALCKDICKRYKLLDHGENYLAERNLNPIFSPSQYQEIEKWIADENLLQICYRLLGDAWDRIEGTDEQCAQIARKMIAENCQKYTRLDLNDLGLTQVPPELFTFPNLTYLNLSNNT